MRRRILLLAEEARPEKFNALEPVLKRARKHAKGVLTPRLDEKKYKAKQIFGH